ncbi:MAG: DUF3667 domain-containing protein [Saprospiraceae bacterium]|nr:DUF3667 domain-containing protein [Saprospiraceae bacterium]
MNKKIRSIKEISSCLNCGTSLNDHDLFCPGCGQRKTDGLITFKDLILDFFDSILNLDSRLVLTVKRMFNPGILTKEFFNGKHKSYYQPLRLFFFCLLILITVTGIKFTNQLKDDQLGGIDKAIYKYDFLSEIDSSYYQTKRSLNIVSDSINSFEMDSFYQAIRVNFLVDKKQVYSNLSLFGCSFRVSHEDLAALTLEEIYTKHNIQSKICRMQAAQAIKAWKSPARFVRYLLANVSWMLLAFVPVLALWLKLLYIRRGRLYIEHVVFLYHTLAPIFLALTAYLFFLNRLPACSVAVFIPVVLIFTYLAMKKYYQQAYIKTLLKFLPTLFVAFIIVSSITTLFLTISLLIF